MKKITRAVLGLLMAVLFAGMSFAGPQDFVLINNTGADIYLHGKHKPVKLRRLGRRCDGFRHSGERRISYGSFFRRQHKVLGYSGDISGRYINIVVQH